MEKRVICSVVLLITILILFASFASAKMTISDVNSVYNLGDKIYTTVDVLSGDVYGNFEINLVCNNESTNIYKVPAEASFAAGEEQKITTHFSLIPESIGTLQGNCFLSSSMGSESTQTKTFVISNSIVVSVKLDKTEYNPGEPMSLSLEATKSNGQLLEGFVEASGAIDFSRAITAGVLNEQIAMPETAEANRYTLNFFVYDRGKNNSILNSGNASISFKINQVPKMIQTSLDKLSLNPDENLTVGVDLFDQAGKQMQAPISVSLVSPNLEEVQQLTVNSGDFWHFEFPSNATAGQWKVLSTFSGINDEKDFILNEMQKVNLTFLGSVLVVQNIGNTPYNQTINVTIGNTTQQLALLNIQLGEIRQFNLKASSEGDWDVSATDGKSIGSGKVHLIGTGNAISIEDLKGVGIFSKYPIIWIFIVLIVAGFVVVFLFRVEKKTFNLESVFDSKKIYPEAKPAVKDKNTFFDITQKVGDAESSAILKGQKSNASVIAIKIKNQITDNTKQEIEKMVAKARVKKGVVEFKDDYVLIIFSPLVTKSLANEWTASKVAYDLSKDLLDYNKRFSNKIEFGIGVNSGDLICAVENGKFKYTSVGGAVMFAKKIASFNSEKVMISEETRRKIMKDLKVGKPEDVMGKNAYEILGINDRDANAGKLDDLLKRMRN